MKQKIPFTSFVSMYNSALKTKHLNTAQVTRNTDFSPSYIYNVLHNYDDHKYIDEDLVVKIGKGFKFNKSELHAWLHSMYLIHPIYQQNGVTHHHMHRVQRRKNQWRYHHHINSVRYKTIGHVIYNLRHLSLKSIRRISNLSGRLVNSKKHYR